ncbi:5218_t:CDS:2 [Cetraspora pellucida]|uniref:5218_t:CDS:1 n=1 Tax=Cetraspora pellucida TaxID=1433469 RepID=A0A9N8WJL2_9GLOM|nr:5218_t:CDS:2 [Cetraspora pellucida]
MGLITRKILSLVKTIEKIFAISKINFFLLFVPVGYIVHFYTNNDTLVFVTNFLAIVPAKRLLEIAAKGLPYYHKFHHSGLLIYTFANVIEFIVAIIALMKGEIRIVQASMLGIIFYNILFVLGSCFLFGGVTTFIKSEGRQIEQKFSPTASQMSSSLMTLACITLILPTALYSLINRTFHFSHETNTINVDDKILHISYGMSLALLAVYALYLCFQLKTHKSLFANVEDSEHENKGKREAKSEDLESGEQGHENTVNREQGHENKESGEQIDETEEEKEIHIGPKMSFILLISTMVMIYFSAEFLVGSIEGIVKSLEISETFIGLILIPILGNFAEHIHSTTIAMKDNMTLAIGITVGCSTQVALFITPILVILGWIIGQPMSLLFSPFEAICLFIAVLLKNQLIQLLIMHSKHIKFKLFSN